MDLELSEEESALQDNVRAVLAGVCPPAAVRGVYEGKGDVASIWGPMVELDWPALAVPEDLGGIGLGFVEVAIVVEGLGRAVAPGPFLATVTQFLPVVRELDACGAAGDGAADLVRRLAAGDLTGTVALAESGRWEPGAVRSVASEVAGGWALRGRKEAVLDGADADAVVVKAARAG